LKFVKGKQKKPWIGAIYGVPGVGKSTLASLSPNPVFIDTEGGLDQIDCAKTETQIKDYASLISALREALKTDFETVVIDTMSGVEEILINKILAETNDKLGTKVESLADKQIFSYGAGFELLKSQWQHFTNILFEVKARGKNVLCVAHEQIEKVENPAGDNYDRYTLNVHKKSVPTIVGKMDFVCFAQYEKQYQTKAGSDKKVANDTGNVVLCTVERPFYAAKNRFSLPEYVMINEYQDKKKFYDLLKGE
jgi:Cdc6-like AAA superfamily ATPase